MFGGYLQGNKMFVLNRLKNQKNMVPFRSKIFSGLSKPFILRMFGGYLQGNKMFVLNAYH